MNITTRIAHLRQSIGSLAGQAHVAQTDAEKRISANRAEASEQLQHAIQDAEAVYRSGEISATASRENAVARLLSELRKADPSSRVRDIPENGGVRAPNPLTRVGTIHGQRGDEAPLSIPLIDSSGVVISSTQQTRELALQLVRSVVADVVSQIPALHLRLSLFDPNVSSELADFGPLKDARPQTAPKPMSEVHELRQRLGEIFAHVQETASMLKQVQSPSLSEYWKTLDTPEGEYHVLVLLDYPAGLDKEGAQRLAKFSHVANKGAFLIVLRTLDHDMDEDLVTADEKILSGCEHVIVHPHSIEIAGYPPSDRFQTHISYDSTAVRDVVKDAVRTAREAKGPVIPLQSVLRDSDVEFWQSSAIDGLETVIGRYQKEPLIVRLRGASPPIANMLIGGAVGQGKSNLLLNIVYGLAYAYPPEELELYLLDFKEGLEFKKFGPDKNGENWLPHASLLGLHTRQEDGLIALRNIQQRVEKRKRLFQNAGAEDYETYRRMGHEIPRLVVVIDEFQVPFSGNNAQSEEAVTLIEQLSRQSRATGTHLILASQALSGIEALHSKRDSVLGQFHARLSLKNNASESEMFFSHENRAAADLTYRGEVILNENIGEDVDKNKRGICALADRSFIASLQTHMWEQSAGGIRRYPFRFTPDSYMPFSAHGKLDLETDDPEDIVLDLGRQLSVEEQSATYTMNDDVNQALAVVGASGGETAGILAAAVRSLYLARPQEQIFVVNVDSATRPAWLDGLEAREPALARQLRYIAREQASEFVADSLPTMRDASIIMLGLQKIRGLSDRLNSDPDSFTRLDPSDFLAEQIGDTPSTNLRFVLRFGSIESVKSVFGYRGNVIGCYALVNQDKNTLLDVTQEYNFPIPTDSPRFVLHSRGTGGSTLTAVPYEAPLLKETN
ncbi:MULTISPECIES: FtsK/SpoIIIE domain-containing protein [Auritidibacter]|uniref:FtsK/SpoIIIE domain-containing protein n=1 Tax=Auritidibacter TaxID=1160973 RepID=UPI000D72DA9D|nr:MULTISPECIES: FtsK/SpoIIIE domain-containing protein [Auritidibacter]AXR73599.1 hypothetical protein DCC27_003990 [Auritidibacter sp. NML130574]NIH70564.1 hypothetical protein [Auritidibacter ignavus]RMX23256.1 hypothetical protein DYI20_05140 [Auritidibacter ignavus]WGH82203.1 FtsK/SpoIIIE domain-containing protein [Auritidibacter ignavus]WGH86796.1 FtsK/SpoIIIE domain-containing protein [Auritidibacter ignavus]